MKPRPPIKKVSDKRLAANGGKMYSTISAPKKRLARRPRSKGERGKAIPKVNLRRQAKRKAGYRKMLQSKEYKAARAEALVRAGNRCEGTSEMSIKMLPNGSDVVEAAYYHYRRCLSTENLHAHHLRYPKTRPLAASDLKILCKFHHEFAESRKMHKQRMF